jgi:beta-N-acetylglucosaminidase
MIRLKIYIPILLFVMVTGHFAQGDPAHPAPLDERLLSGQFESLWLESNIAEIYPTPVEVIYSGQYYSLYNSNGKPLIAISASNKLETKAANVFNRQLYKYNYEPLPIINDINNIGSEIEIIIEFNSFDAKLNEYGAQAYSIKWLGDNKAVVKVSGTSQKGLNYGAVSLAQTVVNLNSNIVMRRADVVDYPLFNRRIFNSTPQPNHLKNDLDWMIRYKMETIGFHNKDWSWFFLDEELKENLREYSEWNQEYGGVDAILMLNLYRMKDLEITNEDHINALKKNINTAFTNGVKRVMLMADDSPPFNYHDGYVLTSENDKQKFSTMAEAHCWMMNELITWGKNCNYDIEYWYCPGFYTYEEMHYGDMELFKNTPWENDAYGPLKRDLEIIGKQMPEEVFVYWTGPYVCTRKITDDDLSDWSNNLHGRVPFLFDNSIFAQLEFTASTMFTGYGNEFPKDFSRKTGGNGLFINGDATAEVSRAASMTANAYMWEGEKYNREPSIINAMTKLYGRKALPTLMKYKDVELKLRKEIKQRQVWFVADDLWKTIRDTRFITDKNPFYYHQNYGRLKALRLQLKHSVPIPDPIEIFKNKCMDLNEQRLTLLEEIESLSLYKLSFSLQAEMIDLPNFSKIIK